MRNRTEQELYEQQRRRDAELARDNANANNGLLLLSLFIVAIAALGAVFFVTTRQSETQAPTQSPDINIELPERRAPEVQPPDINVQPPDVNVQPPDVNVPEVNVPEVNVPDVNVTVPESNVPESNVPESGSSSGTEGTTQQEPTSESSQP